jgi:hypothetical protein
MVNPNRFYTYAYLREDRTPYYIGKGKGKRAYRKYKGETIKPPKDKSRIIFLKQNLIEEEAFRHEIYMIAVFGRKDLGTGILYNRTDGGEGSSGSVRSEETKRKIGEANKGKTHTEEARKKMSEVNKGKIFSEKWKKEHSRKMKENNPFKGKNHTEETKRKMSEKKKGNQVWLGRTHSEETKAKLSGALKGRIFSEQHKRKLSKLVKGTKWWNDGCGNCKRMVECPGNGWMPGRK